MDRSEFGTTEQDELTYHCKSCKTFKIVYEGDMNRFHWRKICEQCADTFLDTLINLVRNN
jgi:DNA replicative helicase MCM subunit Mcm2 (Cdc46/Mcm family)